LIFLVLPHLFRPDRTPEELDAIFFHLFVTDGAEGLGKRGRIAGAESQQIQIAGRPIWRLCLEAEKHGALEHKAVALFRSAQPVKQALDRVAQENELDVFLICAGAIRQACPYGGRHIARLPHRTASM
jgi:hypothetical protein